jgi:hypothetical protein
LVLLNDLHLLPNRFKASIDLVNFEKKDLQVLLYQQQPSFAGLVEYYLGIIYRITPVVRVPDNDAAPYDADA